MEKSQKILYDKTLSFKAKGIFFLILERQGKSLTIEDMIDCARDKNASVSNGVRELMDLGYIKRIQKHDGESWNIFYVVVE